jgi:hypothetical protein
MTELNDAETYLAAEILERLRHQKHNPSLSFRVSPPIQNYTFTFKKRCAQYVMGEHVDVTRIEKAVRDVFPSLESMTIEIVNQEKSCPSQCFDTYSCMSCNSHRVPSDIVQCMCLPLLPLQLLALLCGASVDVCRPWRVTVRIALSTASAVTGAVKN